MLRGEDRCTLSKFEVSVSNYLEVSAFNSACLHEEPVCQGGLPMVNVGNDGKVPDVTREHLRQSHSLARSRNASPATHSFSAGTGGAQTVGAGTSRDTYLAYFALSKSTLCYLGGRYACCGMLAPCEPSSAMLAALFLKAEHCSREV